MNPYSAHNTDPATDPKPAAPDLMFVRVVFYFHVAAVLLCGAFSLSVTGRLNLPDSIANLF
jgi:hypothetical protein